MSLQWRWHSASLHYWHWQSMHRLLSGALMSCWHLSLRRKNTAVVNPRCQLGRRVTYQNLKAITMTCVMVRPQCVWNFLPTKGDPAIMMTAKVCYVRMSNPLMCSSKEHATEKKSKLSLSSGMIVTRPATLGRASD